MNENDARRHGEHVEQQTQNAKRKGLARPEGPELGPDERHQGPPCDESVTGSSPPKVSNERLPKRHLPVDDGVLDEKRRIVVHEPTVEHDQADQGS